MVAEGSLAAGPLQEVVHEGLRLLDPGVAARRLEPDWLAEQAGPLLAVSGQMLERSFLPPWQPSKGRG